MAKYTAKQIAQWFINRNAYLAHKDRGEYITDLKLQKLLYYAQGVYLGLHGKRLFEDKIYAWDYGPVVKSVFNIYSCYKRDPIKEMLEVDVDDETALFLERIQQAYGKFAASTLVDKTHREKPYKETRLKDEITPNIMRNFFKTRVAEFRKEINEQEKEILISFNLLNKNLNAYKRLAE